MATPSRPVRSAADRERNRATPKKRLLADRAARWVVSAGGIGIIASILGILLFIVLEVAPLTFHARVDAGRKVTVASAGKIEAILSDDYRTHVSTLDDRGTVRVVRMSDGKVVYASEVLGPPAAGPPPPPSRSSPPACRRSRTPLPPPPPTAGWWSRAWASASPSRGASGW